MYADISRLQAIAKNLAKGKKSYLELIALGGAEHDKSVMAVHYLVSLKLKPGNREAAENLEWLNTQGVDVASLKDKIGLKAVEWPVPRKERQSPPPPWTDEGGLEADTWYQKAFDAVYSGFNVEYGYYLKALELNPHLRKAWHGLRMAAQTAGKWDLAEKCADAETLLDDGKTIGDCYDILGK